MNANVVNSVIWKLKQVALSQNKWHLNNKIEIERTF